SQSARLRLVGSGPDEHVLRALATDMGLADRVEFTGFCADPAPHLRAADITIVPSRWDGLSLSLLEAMACGRAVVTTRVPGSAELAGAGIVIEPDDEAALATAMDELVLDSERRRHLGQLARERAEQRFSLH